MKKALITGGDRGGGREVCMMRSHLAPDQLKPVRHIDNPVKRKFFTRFVME